MVVASNEFSVLVDEAEFSAVDYPSALRLAVDHLRVFPEADVAVEYQGSHEHGYRELFDAAFKLDLYYTDEEVIEAVHSAMRGYLS